MSTGNEEEGMCGITGYVSTENNDESYETIECMTSCLSHRGPDDRGTQTFSGSPFIALGHTRLSIIDLSTTGHQPMPNQDASLWIVFNGEIYNYRELRVDLKNRGHCFRGTSDTEVLLHMFEEWGESCLTKLDGMFAFAIWDTRRQVLFLARDRLGEKPLFYTTWGNGFAFGSELKAILAGRFPINEGIDPVSVSNYFSFMTTPNPSSIIRSIRQLPPAHFLSYDAIQRTQRIRAYWDISDWKPEEGRSQNSYLEELKQLLGQSVTRRLVADVPVGALLSGGVDSSVVTSHMKRAIPSEELHTFTVLFENSDEYNEGPFARRIASHIGSTHHELPVRLSLVDDLESMVWYWDEPFAVSSAVPIYYIARAAREHVKVILTGDGGDEVFAGYGRYFKDRIIAPVSGSFWRLFSPVPGAHGLRNLPRGLRRILRLLSALSQGPDGGYVYLLSLFSEREKAFLFTGEMQQILHKDQDRTVAVLGEHYERFPGNGGLNRRIYADLKLSLVDEMLAKVDRMTMAAGLEARVPILAHKLVEFAAKLPERLKLNGRTGKYLLKKHAEEIMPRDLVYRPKHGLTVPVGEWLRGDLQDLAWDVLSAPDAHYTPFLDRSAVKRMLGWHRKGRGDWGNHLWAVLVFELWLRVTTHRLGRSIATDSYLG